MRVPGSLAFILLMVSLSALGGGASTSHLPAMTPAAGACGDPCGAIVCPSGFQCTWNDRCQVHCEAQPMTPTFRP